MSSSKSDKAHFVKVFHSIADQICSDPVFKDLPKVTQTWVREMIYYTVPGGKMNRGLTVLHTLELIKSGVGLTQQERYQACVLGWAIEFLQAFFLVADDLMDKSITRRGQPCWYRNPRVGSTAVNDSFILESFVYLIIKQNFKSNPHVYIALMELFHQVGYQTELGQLLDLTSMQPDLNGPLSPISTTDSSTSQSSYLGPATETSGFNFLHFNLERYKKIVKYKTAFYSFVLPVHCGLILAGIKNQRIYDKSEEILCIMGEYFQVQDDYLDCYGTPEQIGKIGTDIEDAKCGWLVVQALERCNKRQLSILKSNYGRHDPQCVRRVKALYQELRLEKVYKDYEEQSYKTLVNLIQKFESEQYERYMTSQKVPGSVLTKLLGKIYKRSK